MSPVRRWRRSAGHDRSFSSRATSGIEAAATRLSRWRALPRQGRHLLVLSLLALTVVVAASSATSAAPAPASDTGTSALPPAAPPLPDSALQDVPPSPRSSAGGKATDASRSSRHQAVPGTSDAAAAAALAGNGIPLVALNAYRNAERRLARDLPGCGLTWSLLAAIGRVESNHGRFAGAQLLADGRSRPPVIGVALDGAASFALVRDTDHGKYDGDPAFDHAVGPMQFIPSTWTMFAVDGDGDHIADPFDIYDAALAAGDYLCAAGRDLRTDAGLHAAVLSYNHSEDYVRLVLDLKSAYEHGVPVDQLPPGVPSGGTLPTPPKGPLPPVNPAPPPAVNPHPTPAPTHTTPAPTHTTPAPTHTTTPTPTPSSTTTPPPSTTPTPTPSPTCPTPTPTPSPTPSPSPDPCATPTPTPTASAPPPAATASSPAASNTPTPTPTPSGTSVSPRPDATLPPPTPKPTPSPTR